MKKTDISGIKTLALIICLVISSAVIGQSKKDKKASGKAKKSSKESTTGQTKVETASAPAPEVVKTHEAEVKKIVKSETGVIRGYDFGTTKQKIKETEDAQYVADGKDFMIYNLNLNEKEKAEIIYYFDESEKLRGIGIAFMVSPGVYSDNVEATMVDDFQNYFNNKYGKFTSNDKGDEVWNAADGSYSVEMGDSSEDSNNIEVEIEIFKKK